MLKVLICVFLILGAAWDLLLERLAKKRHSLPLPENVRDVYDSATYAKWLAYKDEGQRFSLAEGAVSLVLLLAVFLFGVPARLSAVLPAGRWANSLLLMAVFVAASSLVGLPFSWVSQMKIEQKYGFNRMTGATFAADAVKETLISLLLSCGLTAACTALFGRFGNAFFWFVYALLCAFVLAVSMLSFPLMKLFNKFEELPEGTLRTRLTAMFEKHGYHLKNIYVMNASKRTTRSNAFCAGLGRFKRIALYDNLVQNSTEDEIVAVFAHELAHARHRDQLTMTAVQLVSYLPVVLLIRWMALDPACLASLGFSGINFAVILIALSASLLEPVSVLIAIPLCAVSRRFERRADAAAVDEGLAEAMVSALKKLSRDNFSDLNPDPLIVRLTYSHPPVSVRIADIRAEAARRAEEKTAPRRE